MKIRELNFYFKFLNFNLNIVKNLLRKFKNPFNPFKAFSLVFAKAFFSPVTPTPSSFHFCNFSARSFSCHKLQLLSSKYLSRRKVIQVLKASTWNVLKDSVKESRKLFFLVLHQVLYICSRNRNDFIFLVIEKQWRAVNNK